MKCCIYGKEIDEMNSNDPFPYKNEGRCCDKCNYTYVIPARLGMLDTDKPTNSNK